MTTRRQFIQTTMAAGLAAGLGAGAIARPQSQAPQPAPRKLRILILGGTGFLGPAIIRAAQPRGHHITTFTRGRTRPGLFKDDEVEKLHGDRDPRKSATITAEDGTQTTYEGIKSLEGKQWDVCIDDSGYYPRIVKASADLLAPNVGQYIFISSVSAYGQSRKPGEDETAPLAELKDPTVETMGAGYENYGGLKVLCERAVEAACKDKTTIVRPGFIVGPDDPTGRFTYWPVRIDRGGEVMAPGTPKDPIQLVDVRDLGAWLVLLAENKTFGAYDALGPEAGSLTMGMVLDGCAKATSSKHSLTWVPSSWIQGHHVGFPIWVPPEGDSAGFHTRNIARAVKAGLKFRPIADTAGDTLAWWKELPEGHARKKLAGPSPEQEKKLLDEWAQSGTSAPTPKDK